MLTKKQVDEYKEKLIEQQGWVCPVGHQYIEPGDVHIICVNERDYVVSFEGLGKLRSKYGQEYINDKIIWAPEQATEDQVIRE